MAFDGIFFVQAIRNLREQSLEYQQQVLHIDTTAQVHIQNYSHSIEA